MAEGSSIRKDLCLLFGGALIGLGGSILAFVYLHGAWRGVVGAACLLVGIVLVVVATRDISSKRIKRAETPAPVAPPQRIPTVGHVLHPGAEADLEDTSINGMDIGIDQQSGSKLRSKRLSINGESRDEGEEEKERWTTD